MRIAVLIDTWFPFVGGGQINAWEISKRLAQKGFKIDIITRNNGNDNLKNYKNLKVIKLGKRTSPYNTTSKILFIIKSFFYVNKSDYDLVHTHAFLPGITARLLMVFKGIPAIFTVHGTSINTKLNNSFSRWLEKFILTEMLYSTQITVSQDFVKIFNINKHIHYIPNGVDVFEYDKVKTEKFNRPTLIFVGRLHPQKNLATLVDAIFIIKKIFPDIQLLIIGEGTEKEKVKSKIKNLKLSFNIKLLGELRGRELIKYYKSSHVFILPSIYEGQPLSMLEAWASKLPIIVTKTGDNQFIVKEGVNGFLINNPKDTQEIADTVIKIFKNNNLKKMGFAGYILVKEKYNWDKSATSTKVLYESLV